MASKSFNAIIQRKLRGIGVAAASERIRHDLLKFAVEAAERRALPLDQNHVVLFNSHTPELAADFLAAGFPSVGLIEANLEYANRQKERFVANPKVHAYHASIQDDLFATFGRKEVDVSFISRILLPPHGREAKETLLIGCLPFPTLQMRVLESLLTHAIVNSRRVAIQTLEKSWERRLSDEPKAELPEVYPPKTLFHVANFSLILLLSPMHVPLISRLLCSREARFDFFSCPADHFSHVFTTLFDLRLVGDAGGYDRRQFRPNNFELPASSHQHKLEAAGFDPAHYYPLIVAPRPMEDVIREHARLAPEFDNTLVIVELACWMHHTGKFAGAGGVNKLIKTLFPDYETLVPPVFSHETKSKELDAADFYAAFPRIRPLFRTPSGRHVLERFVAALVKVDSEEYAD
ncbi:hypothetical protein M3Y99_00930700 [Aphelenchoides fujianensis]|nr:hypothetical protein M3Y99_00930700 [Aphelenchoides fujianensis]